MTDRACRSDSSFLLHCSRSLILLAMGCLIPSLVLAEEGKPTAAQLEFFEKQIRPLLATHCYECHSVKSASIKGGLRVDSRSALIKGGESGSALDLKESHNSPLLQAVRYESFEMPPRGKLPAADIQALERWIAEGAPWPDEPEPQESETRPTFDLQARKESHWCWQPVKAHAVPEVSDPEWSGSFIDRFIRAGLQENGLQPAPAVDRRVLIRRLTFDLTGLAPTPQEIDDYLSDTSDTATEKVVDRLLASPRFGERWARHWLDLVRFGESRGHEFDNDASYAWQYRDYVIRALNSDVPYGQFVREHLAGDLVDPPRLNPEQGFNESVLGTGFWHLGEWVHSPVDIRKDEADRFDNMLDVMSKTFLGITLSCARCHDHKFDAISAKDYYAMSGFLQGSDFRHVPFGSQEQNRKLTGELGALDESARQQVRKTLLKTTQDRLIPLCETLRSMPLSVQDQVWQDGRVLFDYGQIPAEAFIQDGSQFGTRPVHPGDVVLRSANDAPPEIEVATFGYARHDPFWKGVVTPVEATPNQQGRLERIPRPGRTLRTPTFSVEQGPIACLIRGRGHIVACVDSHRLVSGPLHGETIVHAGGDEVNRWRWVTLNLARYKGHRVHLEITPDADDSIDVRGAIELPPGAPLPSLDGRAFAGEISPERLQAALTAWADAQQPSTADLEQLVLVEAVMKAVLQSQDKPAELTEALNQWQASRRELRSRVATSPLLAMAMLDGTGEDDHLLIRGNTASPGEVVARRFLEAVDGPEALSIRSGSGRSALAERILDPANPLTSRVIVNRLWHHLMGRGIVPSVDDFGVLGQRPTHLELLDALALRFNEDQQSLKSMIRLIVLSRTYRMSGHTTPEAREADPNNLLWHHRPPRRLEGEAIRDQLLQISGELDLTMYGPSIPVHLTTFMEGRGRPRDNGPLNGAGRRSIYQAVRRNFLSPFMLTFDTPNPFSTMGRRNVSNVPAQALILLNDPFVQERARAFAQRALKEVPDNAQGRIEWMTLTALGRLPTERERALAEAFVKDASSSPDAELTAWTDFAHSLINVKEFIFVQ